MRCITALVIALTLMISASSGAHGSPSSVPGPGGWQWKYRVWMPAHWQRLAQCESGSNPPNWQHGSRSGFQGAFGFAASTWRGYKLPGYPATAIDATPWQQYRTALRVARDRGGIRHPWGCWRGDDHAWVRGDVSYYAVE